MQRERAAIEMYCQRRYFTITGRHVQGAPATLEDRPEALAALYAELSGKMAPARPSPASCVATDDQALLEKAMAAKNGA